ncbi:VIR protein [Plasmodium vivax]|uniref:VIR protein n=1 Tax=Plasmodium vivax TaxID=5855 RepID=A0A1G4HDR3_PLAVI|nr:VIR protein [Plasmodium vivax]
MIWLSKSYNNKFNEIDNGEHIKKRCIYFKYWFYDQILKKKINDSEVDNLIKDCISKKNLYSSDESFSCKFYELNLDNIKEIKKLYHFLIIYNIYKNNDIYPSAYCQYINVVSDIINNNNRRCDSHSNDAYCHEYNTYIKPYIKEDILPLPEDKCEKPTPSISTQGVNEKTGKLESKYPIYFHLEKNEKNICSSYKDNDKNSFSDTCQALTSATVEYKDNIKKLCEDIIKLFCTLPERDENNNIRDNYLKFLNFWFNRELKKLITDKITRSSVYSHFNSLCSKVKDLNELKNNINEIDDVQYDKWCVLYELYDNYNKIINECIKKRNDLQNKCTKYYQEVVDLFNKGINYFNENSDYEFNNSMKELNFLYSKFKQEKNFQKIIKQKELKELGFVSDSKKKKVPNVDVICKSLSDADKIRSVNINSEYGVILENTPAQKIYKNFYKENIDESSCIKYCDALISENVDNNKDARICAKIVTNLKKLPNIKDVGDTHEDRCSNLTYWTYDILMKEFNTNKNVIVDNNIISELNNAIFRANRELKKDENCTYYIDGTFTEWTEEKNLHDYFENYSTFIKNITDNVKNETYCQYIDYISNLYKKYIKKCCSCYSRPEYVCEQHCPKFFKCNREFFPIHLLHKLECKDNVSLEKEKEIFESLIVDLDVIRKSQFVAMNFYKILTQDYFYRFIFTTFILLGIFFIFFIFYKFTPNRLMLNEKRSKKKQNNYHNNGSNRKQLLEDEKKYMNGNSNKQRLRIAYHST